MVEKFIQEFTKAAHDRGIRNLEFYTESVEKISVSLYNSEPEAVQQSDVVSCYVEGEYNGFKGYISVEDFSEEFFEEEISNLCQIAEYLKEPYAERNLTECLCSREYHLTDAETITKRLLAVEKEYAGSHPKFSKFPHLSGNELIRRISIQNDRGGHMEDTVKFAGVHLGAEAAENGVVQTARNSELGESFETLDIAKAAEEAVQEAGSILNAKPVKTGKYPVILKNGVLCEMLGMHLTAFCGDSVRRNMSKIGGMEGQKIASEVVTLVEEPDGLNARAFDDEGTPTSRKEIIRGGILKTYLYNLSEARLAGKEPTGNGFKENYRSVPGIRITNLKLEGQNKSREMLMEEMGDGLYITACDGMFAGADPVSGDFSLISKGYVVKNGAIMEGVNQITVAGNFYEMLKEIEAVGNDYLTEGGADGVCIAPSILVRELVVSGL